MKGEEKQKLLLYLKSPEGRGKMLLYLNSTCKKKNCLQNIKILKKQGTLVGIGLLGGSRASLSLGQLLAKRLTIKGTVLRSRSTLEKQRLVAAFRYYAESALEKKELQFEPVHAVYSIHQIEEAHQELEYNQVWSKSVISWTK